jgi:Tfp pilus assembly protein FimT
LNRERPPDRDDRPTARPLRTRTGATLVEAAVVLTLIGILCGILVPSAGRLLDRLAVRGAATEVRTALALARHSAVARSSYSTVRIDGETGEIVVLIGEDTVTYRNLTRSFRVTLHSNRDSMAYSPIGLGYGAANQTIVLSRGAATESVVVSRLGRVRRK